MMYKRFENKNKLDKSQKIKLLEEYTKYYENIKSSQGIEKINIKIPREFFDDVTDKIGTVLIEKSNELSKNGLKLCLKITLIYWIFTEKQKIKTLM